MIERESQSEIFNLLKQFPAVGILGPRQIGKTTLAFQIAEKISPEPIYLDLESPSDVAQLSEPELYFDSHSDRTIILDEIQRTPEIFTVLRGVIDKRRRAGQKTGQFLILGSASLDLLQQSSESLAGRIAYTKLTGLKATEIDNDEKDKLWLRGGFPESFLAESNNNSFEWRQNLITTYLERDIPQLGFRISASVLRNFWTMLANVQGGISNMSRIAAGLGISVPTANRYLDLLEDLFLVRKLQPWSVNIGKRLVRTPKIYIRDSGITHTLLKIRNQDDLLGHPVLGGSWEGFIIENLLSVLPDWVIPYYYRTAAGAEIDLVLEINHQTRIAIEIKRSLTPAVSKGFSAGSDDIQATHKYFVYPGKNSYMISSDVKVVPLDEMMKEIRKIVNLE
jgi:predicted AAA+ superfamily ATPase